MGNIDCKKTCEIAKCGPGDDEQMVQFVGGDPGITRVNHTSADELGRENTTMDDVFQRDNTTLDEASYFQRENTTFDEVAPYQRENTLADDAGPLQREGTTADDAGPFRESTILGPLAPIEESPIVGGVPVSRDFQKEVRDMGLDPWIESEDTFDNPHPDIVFSDFSAATGAEDSGAREQQQQQQDAIGASDTTAAAGKGSAVPAEDLSKHKAGSKQKSRSKKRPEERAKDERTSGPALKAFSFKERKQIWAKLSDSEKEAHSEELNVAAKSGDMQTIARLLDAGYVANHSGSDGCTAMHIAAQAGYANVVEALLTAGGNTASVTKAAKMTPLHFAAKNMRRPVLEVLVPRSTLNVKDKNGKTAADLAKDDVKEWLSGNPANTPPPWKQQG